MSVEKPLGEVLFTLVMKQVPWNEVLQSSQEMLQYIYLYLSYIPYRLPSVSENYLANSGGQGKCISAALDRTTLCSYTGHTSWVLTETGCYWVFCFIFSFFLCLKLSHSQQHLLKMLLRKGPQNKVLHHLLDNRGFNAKLTPLTLIFSDNSELRPQLPAQSV